MSFGTTWAVCAGAWLTEWERTGDKKWRDRIVAGMDSIGRMPNGWLTGGAPYDLKSGRFLIRDAIGICTSIRYSARSKSSGLIALIDVPVPGRMAGLLPLTCPRAVPRDHRHQLGGRNLKQGHSRLTAYAAHELYQSRRWRGGHGRSSSAAKRECASAYSPARARWAGIGRAQADRRGPERIDQRGGAMGSGGDPGSGAGRG